MIFFSQGYTLEQSPKTAVICVPAVYVAQVTLKAVWPRNAGPC